MFGYMTELDKIDIDSAMTTRISASGHDLPSLLFAFLDEFLYSFSTTLFVAKRVFITTFDEQEFKIEAFGYGEKFDLSRHPQGTEVKAITYSNLQIYTEGSKKEVYVILDI